MERPRTLDRRCVAGPSWLRLIECWLLRASKLGAVVSQAHAMGLSYGPLIGISYTGLPETAVHWSVVTAAIPMLKAVDIAPIVCLHVLPERLPQGCTVIPAQLEMNNSRMFEIS